MIVVGCTQRGGIKDKALVKQAQKSINIIKNAIEEYKIDNKSYPEENSNLKELLAPYLSRAIYSESKVVTSAEKVLLNAQNKLEEIKEKLKQFERIEEIKKEFAQSCEGIKEWENLLNGREGEVSKLKESVTKIKTKLQKINPQQKVKEIKDSLLLSIGESKKIINLLLPQVKKREHLLNIKKTLEWEEAKLKGEKITPEERYSLESELFYLQEEIPDTHVLVASIATLNSLKERQIYYNYVSQLSPKVDTLLTLISSLLPFLPSVHQSGIIISAYSYLHKMADAIQDYKRENGKFPSENINIDSLLHHYFVETTISGKIIDRWEEVCSWFTSPIDYKLLENGFSLQSKAKDNNNTLIKIEVKLHNKWEELISSFDTPPIYTTCEGGYFLKAKAKDSGKTWVSARPSFKEGG